MLELLNRYDTLLLDLDGAGDQPITGENCPVEIEQKGVVAVEQLKHA